MINLFRNIVVAVFLLGLQSATAQLDIGAKAGLTYGNVQISNIENDNISEIFVDNHIGFQAGFFGRINIIKFYIQPEILFTQINANLNIHSTDNRYKSVKYQLHRLDVPFPLGVKLGSFRIYAGPVASFNLNSAATMFNDVYKQGSWSLLGGVGINFWKMDIELKYEGALTEYATEASVEIGDEVHFVPLDVRNSQFILSLGYKFGD